MKQFILKSYKFSLYVYIIIDINILLQKNL